MKGKVVLITGANRGLGLESAKQLAQKGAEILLVCRDQKQAEEAQASILAITPGAICRYFIADLSSHTSIRSLAEQIHVSENKIDVLINNAGAVFPEFSLTEDGLERTIAINHFSYFLLSYYLLDLIRASEQGRIVNVASDSHYQGRIDLESFTIRKDYFIIRAYEQSKLANVLFTYALAARLKDTPITVNAIHPGRVKTDIGVKNQPWYVAWFWKILTLISSVSVEKGAKTQIFAASDKSLSATSGKYFSKCKMRKSSLISYDIQLGNTLWAETERLSGVRFLSI